jgi:hypothetical protein
MTNNPTNNPSLETSRLLPLAATGGIIGAVINAALVLLAPSLLGQAIQAASPGSTAQDVPVIVAMMASFIPAFAAAGVLWLLNKFTKTPLPIFQILGVILALLSLLSPLGLPVSTSSKVMLEIMHIVAATSIILALSRAKKA